MRGLRREGLAQRDGYVSEVIYMDGPTGAVSRLENGEAVTRVQVRVRAPSATYETNTMSKTKIAAIVIVAMFAIDPLLAFLLTVGFGAWLIIGLFIAQLKNSGADLTGPF